MKSIKHTKISNHGEHIPILSLPHRIVDYITEINIHNPTTEVE
jgi:hypothetical protein